MKKKWSSSGRFLVIFMALLGGISLIAEGQQGYNIKSRGMPAYPFPIEAKQPNGDKIVLKGVGDRMVHWYETTDGYSVLKNKNSAYVFAESDGEGGMKPSEYLVGSSKGSAPSFITRGLKYSNVQMDAFSKNYFLNKGAKANPIPFPSKGTNNVLVILAEFPDQPRTGSQVEISNLMNQELYNGTGSFRDYYRQMSYDSLILNTTVTPWVQLSHNMSYYGSNDADGYDIAPFELVREAVDLVEASGFDFSPYDNDNDGYVDEIVVFHSGYGEQFTDAGDTCIWSHAFHLGDLAVTYDGVRLDNYIIAPELYYNSGSTITTIGTIVHEFAHSLAIPDLNDEDGEGSGGYAFDLNFWDLMAAGSWNEEGIYPAGMNAWLKEYMGWMTIPLIDQSGSYSLNNVYENQEAYRINTSTHDEFFILENRQWYGFDNGLPGFGMLIYHVDLNYPGWALGNVNVDPLHQGFDLVEADNIRDSLTIDGDPFPGWDTITSFTPFTTPNINAWNGSVTPISIINIAEADSIITFDILSSIFDEAPAAWTVNSSLYSDSGRIVAMLHLVADTASTGFLAAFAGAECRGVAPVLYYPAGNNYVFELDVFSNTVSGENLTFSYYDPVLDSTYAVLESLEFVPDSIAGSLSIPYEMHTPAIYSRSFIPGWNWFSLNVLQDDMSPNNVLSLCTSANDYVKNQTQSTTYYSGFGWFGTIEQLSTNSLYLIRAGTNCGISYSGLAENPVGKQFNLVPGWNWISYTPQVAIPAAQALASLTPSNLDYIKNQTSSLTYYAGFGWFGTLEELRPGQGYMMRLAAGGTLEYPVHASAKKAIKKEVEIASHFSLDPGLYENNGSITASVFMNGMNVGREGDILYAFAGEECRGQVSGMYFEPAEAVVFPMMVFSNQIVNEVIHFKYYSAEEDKIFDCKGEVVFEKDMILGDAMNSIEFEASSYVDVRDADIIFTENFRVHPIPFGEQLEISYKLMKRTPVKIEVYNIFGSLIDEVLDMQQEAGEYHVVWRPEMIENGSYFIKIKTADNQVIKRITHIK